jgi:hypothetical protein
MIAQFQQHVADTINEATANSMRGANQVAFGEDQIVRACARNRPGDDVARLNDEK